MDSMKQDPRHIRHRTGFSFGYTPITSAGEARLDTGMDFGVHKLRAGESVSGDEALEEAWLLLDGDVCFVFDGEQRVEATRRSMFDDEPVALHHAAGHPLRVEAREDSELIVLRAPNQRDFDTRVFDAETMLDNEQRDHDKLGGTSHRVVRTIFDVRNRPEAELVLGEVVNLPGRWSSYPPHHHRQPEIYHYRFSHPAGFGHAELGEDVIKVRPFDTIKILDLNDHSQVAAPGYAMAYVWAIRHLPGDPYTVPDFTEDHAWLREPDAPVWQPKPVKGA